MKRIVVVGGRTAHLTVEGGRFRYERQDGEVIEGEFSMERGPGGGIYFSDASGGIFKLAPR